jgi:hypothetical protein
MAKFKAPLTRRGGLSSCVYIYYIYECERAGLVTSIVFAALQKLSKKQRRYPVVVMESGGSVRKLVDQAFERYFVSNRRGLHDNPGYRLLTNSPGGEDSR